MKYIVRCQAEAGEIINEYTLEATSQEDAHIRNHQHPEYDASMQKAFEQGICEFQFVIYPLSDMN